MQYYYPMMNGGSAGWGLIMMLFWLVIIIVIAVVVVRLLKDNGTTRQHKVNPMDIIKERYAKGEITKEQFQLLKKDLTAR